MPKKVIELLNRIVADPAFEEGRAWRRYRFEPNQVIVGEGEEGHALYVVEEGRVRVTGRVEVEGNRFVQPGLCDLGPGELFGEHCLFHSEPRSASVVGVTGGTLLEIDSGALEDYLDHNPQLGYHLLKQLFSTSIHRLGKANQRVEHLFAWGLKVHDIARHL